MLTGSVRSEAASGLTIESPELWISDASDAAESLMNRLTRAYSSAYAWLGPLRMPGHDPGLHWDHPREREWETPRPVSSPGVENARRSAASHTLIPWAFIQSANQTGFFPDIYTSLFPSSPL